jgi:hypothetical protein
VEGYRGDTEEGVLRALGGGVGSVKGKERDFGGEAHGGWRPIRKCQCCRRSRYHGADRAKAYQLRPPPQVVGEHGLAAGCGPRRWFQDDPGSVDVLLGAAALVFLECWKRKTKAMSAGLNCYVH